ncbi:MAG: hypothetical protein ACI4WM_10375 [Erysipelotrichaceae bacterium]
MIDKLALLRGEPYHITNLVAVNNPTIGSIVDYREDRYWGLVTRLCATSFDYRLSLDENGIDYLTVDDWHMFLNVYMAFDYEETKVLLPNLDIASLHLAELKNGELALVNDNYEVVINEFVYGEMVDFIRDCHGIKRNFKKPGNEMARVILMREAREEREMAKRKTSNSFESYLEPLISALCNSEGFKYNFDTVWGLPIYTFMDATRRIQKIKSADHLMGGMYSGMLDVSKMNKGQLNKDLNWMGELK